MARDLQLRLSEGGREFASVCSIRTVVIAGWTGRDRQAVEEHIRELEAVGIARPSSVPVYYRVSAARLTTDREIESAGEDTSGEVEFLLLQHAGRLWVGVGSDHTDRRVETFDVTASKQVCDKPIADLFWSFEDVAAHWDELEIRSEILEGGSLVSYQEGRLDAILPPGSLMEGVLAGGDLQEGCLMFCGTLAAKGGIRPSSRFDFSLHDPRLRRTISHGYVIKALPVAG